MPVFYFSIENLVNWWYYSIINEVIRLKISTKGRYALRMMVDLAQNQGDGYVSLKDIADRQGISKKYLEQIVSILNKPEILRTNRGYQGGYRLAQSANRYTVGDILRLTEGGIAPVACLDTKNNECPRADLCETLFVWKGLNDVVNRYLDSITVQDIVDKSLLNENFDYII